LHEGETVSCTGREHKLQIFEDKVTGKTFELRKDEVNEQFRVSQNEELYELYKSANVIRIVKPRRV
jgi:hypothetical protein